MDTHVIGNLVRARTTFGDELNRFNLELACVRLPRLRYHDRPPAAFVAAFRTVHKTGEDPKCLFSGKPFLSRCCQDIKAWPRCHSGLRRLIRLSQTSADF